MTELPFFFRDTNASWVKTKYQCLSSEALLLETGLMQWRIKGIYLDPQPLPFVSSWFVLMWEPNPAKADYTCIKFLKIAIVLIPHLQWKCNGSRLQKINCLCYNTARQNEAFIWCFQRDIVTLMCVRNEVWKKCSVILKEQKKLLQQRLLTPTLYMHV